VFTTELIDGLPVDQCRDLDEESRLQVSRLIMNLCLHELFDFRYMQTDPNWANFFYNPDTRKVLYVIVVRFIRETNQVQSRKNSKSPNPIQTMFSKVVN